MREDVTLAAFPARSRWLNDPVDWSTDGEDNLTISAGPRTDLFADPGGAKRHANAPALIGRRGGDFVLSASVRADLTATYDAGVLLLYGSENVWAKLCLELSPQGRPTIVSVVTRDLSDDCNSFPVDGDQVRLRVSRIGSAYAFHVASGGGFWHLVRYFSLDGDLEVGFLAQSPVGEGCVVHFHDIRYAPERLIDIRGGE